VSPSWPAPLERSTSGRHSQGCEITAAVEHAIGEGLPASRQMQDVELDRILGDEIDDADGARLVFAPF
jgi:hypothetical protein